jgi:hypothetical protein
VILNDATVSLTGTATFNGPDHLASLRDVLLIELKKGHANLTKGRYRNEFVCVGLQHEAGDQDHGRKGVDAGHHNLIAIR